MAWLELEGQPWKLHLASGVGGGSGNWYGSHGRRSWSLNESTKLLGVGKKLANFEGQYLQSIRKKKKIIQGKGKLVFSYVLLAYFHRYI